MLNNGFINEHGHAGMHTAYGIKMSYHYLNEETLFVFNSKLQFYATQGYIFYPLVQIIGEDGIVHECDVSFPGVPTEDTIRLEFSPAFTGWVVVMARVYNCVLFDFTGDYGGSFSIEHELDIPAFCTVTDHLNDMIEAEIQIVDQDNVNINISPDGEPKGSVHGLRNPMFRKYKINVADSPYNYSIKHYLGTSGLVRPPYVMVVDTFGYVVNCEIKHLNMDEIELEFSEAFEGYAYLLMG